MNPRPKTVHALILDMDNTLYDWVAYFVPAIQAMVAEAAKLLKAQEDDLRDDLRDVHRQHGNTEHPFALLETRAVERILPGLTRRQRHDFLMPAFTAFNDVRRDHLRLYPEVDQTLRTVREAGCRIVGHTEAKNVNIASRARALGLQTTLEVIYAPRFLGPPHPLGDDRVRPPETLEIRPLPAETRKPNPDVARRIANQLRIPVTHCLYVGDSLSKDVGMANRAGMLSAWARYGTRHDAALWKELVALSHWDAPSVAAAEQGSTAGETNIPDVTLDAFGDLLRCFTFEAQPAAQFGAEPAPRMSAG